mgnify:CR=1 FL=1
MCIRDSFAVIADQLIRPTGQIRVGQIPVFRVQHRALQQLSQKERSFILDYYGMEKPSTLQLAKRYGISQPAAHKRLKKIEEKIKKLVAIF